MQLRYPLEKDMESWNKRVLPSIALNATHSSAYNLVSLAESGTDIYVCFTNKDQNTIWIEKTSKLLGESGMYFRSFQQMNDEEFAFAHKFFIKQGVLDG